jgi:hypothetical protein
MRRRRPDLPLLVVPAALAALAALAVAGGAPAPLGAESHTRYHHKTRLPDEPAPSWTCVVSLAVQEPPPVATGSAPGCDGDAPYRAALARACATLPPTERAACAALDGYEALRGQHESGSSAHDGPTCATTVSIRRPGRAAQAAAEGPDEEAACRAAAAAACRGAGRACDPTPPLAQRWPFDTPPSGDEGRVVCVVRVASAGEPEKVEETGTSAVSLDDARERALAALRRRVPEADLSAPPDPGGPLFGGPLFGDPTRRAPHGAPEPPAAWSVVATATQTSVRGGAFEYTYTATVARTPPSGRGLGVGADEATACARAQAEAERAFAAGFPSVPAPAARVTHRVITTLAP